MSTAAVPKSRPGRSIILSDVDWPMYTRLLRTFAERPRMRLTYDRGELEIMSPSIMHDGDSRFLVALVFVLTEELGLPIKPGGATTLRRRLHLRGLEPDECFWIANAHRIHGQRRLDLRRDPPPDLAIEVDVTRSSMNRLGIYAVLGVPEVWRLHGDDLTFHVLNAKGKYATSSTSQSFPLLKPADVVGFLKKARKADDVNPVLRDFRAWVRERMAEDA